MKLISKFKGGKKINNTEIFDKYRNITQKIENDYLESLINQLAGKVYGEGSNITLENTLQARFNKLIPKGQIGQKSTKGYNLYSVRNFEAYTKKGITISSNGEYLILNGTANGLVDIYLEDHNYNAFNSMKSYINSNYGRYYNYLYNSELLFYSKVGTTYSINNFDIAEDKQLENLFIRVPDGTTLNNVKIGIMIEANRKINFEPYTDRQASPSNNYKQPIQCVTGKQNILIKDENSNVLETTELDLKDIKIYEDGIITEEDGAWYLENVWCEKIFNGSEQFGRTLDQYGGGYSFFKSWSNADLLGKAHERFYCNMGTYTNELADYKVGKIFSDAGMAMNLYPSGEVSTDEDFKAKLKELYDNGTPCYIVYKLLEPVKTPITDTDLIKQLNNLKKLMSINGTTVIECESEEGNLPFILEVEALSKN